MTGEPNLGWGGGEGWSEDFTGAPVPTKPAPQPLHSQGRRQAGAALPPSVPTPP